jgi:hypothetical protein
MRAAAFGLDCASRTLDSRLSLAGIDQQADGLLHPRELEGGQAVTIVQVDNAGADDAAHFFVDEVLLGAGSGVSPENPR